MSAAFLLAACAGDTLYDDPDPPPGGTPRPRIVIASPSTASFALFEGAPAPEPVTRRILNGTAGSVLSELTLEVSYQSGSGWLEASLVATTAPTDLRLSTRTAGLPPGTYTASVRVSSSIASNTASVPVTLVVRGVDTTELVAAVNAYRVSQGLPAVAVSQSLTRVADAHVRDLELHSPHGGVCNLHSWSGNGPWTPCCYTADHAQAQCMWRKPREITGVYTGTGYENAVGGTSTNLTASGALNAWRGSQPHHDVILNRGVWASRTWRAIAAANSGRYAVLWFGEQVDPAR